MSRERLEEIEGKHSTIIITSKQDGFEYTEVIVEDLVFLIQNGFRQAERVQELETVIEQDKRQSVLEGLYEQNKRYREALEWYSENSPHGNIADEALEESE